MVRGALPAIAVWTCKADHQPALVTGQIAKEVEVSGKELEKLYAALGEKVLKLQ